MATILRRAAPGGADTRDIAAGPSRISQRALAFIEQHATAGRVGYGSASQFHRIFERHHAQTPGAWRRGHHEA